MGIWQHRGVMEGASDNRVEGDDVIARIIQPPALFALTPPLILLTWFVRYPRAWSKITVKQNAGNHFSIAIKVKPIVPPFF